jgi:HD-like signal output (HDOD) protein
MIDTLPDVPCLIRTRLQLELLLQESPLDLGAVSNVILSDPGATLQMLRLVGEEFPDSEDRPTRMEDCIASLNRDAWQDVVCASTIPQNSTLVEEWTRVREVARCARGLAQCVDGFLPEQAYLVGLLYDLGRFPALLGWSLGGETSAEQRSIALMLSDHWNLPEFVLVAIREQQDSGVTSRWGVLIHFARSVAEKVRFSGNM